MGVEGDNVWGWWKGVIFRVEWGGGDHVSDKNDHFSGHKLTGNGGTGISALPVISPSDIQFLTCRESILWMQSDDDLESIGF